MTTHDLNALQVLKTYFPQIKEFWDLQEEAIAALCAGSSRLCLAPTGGGKSLIFQVAGLLSGKTTIVISPLVALMDQQAGRMAAAGIRVEVLHSALSGLPYYSKVRSLFDQAGPQFLFVSPERLRFDGYLNHTLCRNRRQIGLIVIDEAHCISQWGESFRPSYRTIPPFLTSVFGSVNSVLLLCLTATLSVDDQKQICADFGLKQGNILKSKFLLRTNLDLSFQTEFADEQAKRDHLEVLLRGHRAEKIIVYVHRKKSDYGTRSMAKWFGDLGFNCAAFDASMGDAEKRNVREGFESGRIPLIFATSAFGMGMDIHDIRGVIHYLAPESLEQYYQEVGRAGRDGKRAFGCLLFSKTNIKVRRDLLRKSFPTSDEIKSFYEKKLSHVHPTGYIQMNPWLELDEDSREGLILQILEEAGVVKLATLGMSGFECFEPTDKVDDTFYRYEAASPIKATLDIAKRTGVPLAKIIADVYDWLDDGSLRLASVPAKVGFYQPCRPLNDEILAMIMTDLDQKKEKRLANFEQLVSAIQSGDKPESIIASHLGVETPTVAGAQ